MVKPPDFDPSQSYPLILHIHGGPHAMYGVGFNYSFQNFAANDYVVLYTNPRGSTGYGTAFGNAIHDAYPSVDYDDLMAGVEAVEARGYIDSGASLRDRSQRRRRALELDHRPHESVRGGGGARPGHQLDQLRGQHRHPAWGYARFDKPFWENPQKWLEHSPLMYVKNVRTPTLLMTGELDLRTPIGQSRGVLPGPQDARRPDRDAPLPRGIPRHRLQAGQLHPHAAIHRVLVRQVPGTGGGDVAAVRRQRAARSGPS